MKLSNKLRFLLNTYYAFQSGAAAGRDYPKDWKEKCLKAIDAECVKRNIGMCAAAGTFFFSRGKQKVQVSRPYLPDEPKFVRAG